MKKMLKLAAITILCAAPLGMLMLSQADTRQEETIGTAFGDRYHIATPPMPISLSFAGEVVPLNDWNVRERLEKELLVNTYWQSSTMLMLKRTKRYFKDIEPILKTQSIPDDFKYLAMAESGLTDAVSSSGARGIWQFMQSTAESYGMEITTEVDERYNLEKATIATCKYLQNSKNDVGSWTMAAAAFNRGLAGIKADARKQKVTSYYDLLLNSETSRYMFRILALKVITENPSKYGYHLEKNDFYNPIPTYVVQVDSSITALADFAISHGTTYRDVKLLNPWLRDDHLTVRKGSTYRLIMPDSVSSN